MVFPGGPSEGADVVWRGIHCVLLVSSGENGVVLGEGVTLSEIVPGVNRPPSGVAVTVDPRLSDVGLAVLRGVLVKRDASTTTGELV